MEKENKKTIEIPFGANDSELYKFEYTIPEGYEARIEDGKVIVTKKESEDERIRKGLIRHLEELRDWKVGTMSPIKVKEHYDVWIAYLERQKEQNPFTPKYRVGEVMRTKQEASEGITDGLPVIVSIDDNYYYCTNEKIPISKQEEYEFPPMNMRQKSAEWSDEDERKRNGIIKGLEDRMGFGWASDPFSREEYISWLKSLRPQPKQEWSEGDKGLLERAISIIGWAGSCTDKYKIINPDGAAELQKFLKSLRPQSEQEWSEEERRLLLNAQNAVYQVASAGIGGYTKKDYEEISSFFHTLRPQLRWKPSEEQMKAILDAMIPATGNTLVYLNSLYEQLKTL